MPAQFPRGLDSPSRPTRPAPADRGGQRRANPRTHSPAPRPHAAVAVRVLSGTALNMAVDLAGTPTTGFRVQACGDSHLRNFRCFATPERRVIFDIQRPGRDAACPLGMGRETPVGQLRAGLPHNGFGEKVARDAVLTCVRSYREPWRGSARCEPWTCGMPDRGRKLIPTIEDEDVREADAESAGRKRRTVRRRGRVSRARRTPPAEPRPSRTTRRSSTTISSTGRRNSTHGSRKSLPATANRCRKTGVSCWTDMPSWTRPSRWWASAASAPFAASRC